MQHRASARATIFRPRHSSKARRHAALTVLAWIASATTGFALVFAQTTIFLIENSFVVRDISAIAPAPEPFVPPDPDDPLAGRPINILLIGSDVRDGGNARVGGFVEGMRADATVIMHISADRERIELVSIPRDLRVAVPDCELFDGTVVRGWTAKFNVAFSNGGREGDPAEGAACVQRTIYEMSGGLTFDHYVVMDFVGFKDMINSLGGVPMCVPQRMYSSKAKLNLEAGPQTMDGETALAFARARTGTGLGDGSDLNRIDRQQELMENTMRTALGKNILTDVSELTLFLRSVAEALTLDPELGSVQYVTGLGFGLRDFNPNNLHFETIPWTSPGDGSGDVVMLPEAAEVFAKLLADEPLGEPEDIDPVNPPPPPGANDAEETPASNPKGRPAPSPTPLPTRDVEAEILDACSV